MSGILNLKKNFFIILLSAISLTGVCLLLLSTSKWGIILDMDSVYYLLLAQLFEHSSPHRDIVIQYLCNVQPLFPIVLSWGHLIRLEPHEAARWLNAILFGLNIILTGVITKKYTRSAWIGLSAALLVLSTPDILEIHLSGQNEPLFIFFMLTWLLLFLDYLQNSKLSVLVLSSVIAALASMTRFAGIPMVITGLFVILFLGREKNLINRSIHALILGLIPGLSLFLLSKYTYIADSPLQRHFTVHPVQFSFFQDIVSAFWSWFLSPNISIPVNEEVLLSVIGTASCLIWLWGRRHADKAYVADPQRTAFTKFSVLGIALICAYVVCLIIAGSFFDADTYHCIPRLLIPAHIVGLVMLCGLISNFFRNSSSSFQKDIGKIIIAYLILFNAIGSAQCLAHQYYFGDYYNDNPFRLSYVIREIKTLPEGAPIYTNDFQSVYVWGGKFPFLIPTTRNLFSLKENSGYLNQLSKMTADLRKNKGILVYFNNNIQKYAEPIKTLQKRIPLHLIARDKYASVFDVQ